MDSLLVSCFLETETQELWGNNLLLRAREKERWEGSLQKKSEADNQRKAEMSLATFSPILVPPRAGWPAHPTSCGPCFHMFSNHQHGCLELGTPRGAGGLGLRYASEAPFCVMLGKACPSVNFHILPGETGIGSTLPSGEVA